MFSILKGVLDGLCSSLCKKKNSKINRKPFKMAPCSQWIKECGPTSTSEKLVLKTADPVYIHPRNMKFSPRLGPEYILRRYILKRYGIIGSDLNLLVKFGILIPILDGEKSYFYLEDVENVFGDSFFPNGRKIAQKQ